MESKSALFFVVIFALCSVSTCQYIRFANAASNNLVIAVDVIGKPFELNNQQVSAYELVPAGSVNVNVSQNGTYVAFQNVVVANYTTVAIVFQNSSTFYVVLVPIYDSIPPIALTATQAFARLIDLSTVPPTVSFLADTFLLQTGVGFLSATQFYAVNLTVANFYVSNTTTDAGFVAKVAAVLSQCTANTVFYFGIGFGSLTLDHQIPSCDIVFNVTTGATTAAATTGEATTGSANTTTGDMTTGPTNTTGNSTTGEMTTGAANMTTGAGNMTTGAANTTTGEMTTGAGNTTTGEMTTGAANMTTGAGNMTTGAANTTTGEMTTGASNATTGDMTTGSTNVTTGAMNSTTGAVVTTATATTGASNTTNSTTGAVATTGSAATTGSKNVTTGFVNTTTGATTFHSVTTGMATTASSDATFVTYTIGAFVVAIVASFL